MGGQARPRCWYTCSVVAVGESKFGLLVLLSILLLIDVSIFRVGLENELVSTLSEAVGENGEKEVFDVFVAITLSLLFGNGTPENLWPLKHWR